MPAKNKRVQGQSGRPKKNKEPELRLESNKEPVPDESRYRTRGKSFQGAELGGDYLCVTQIAFFVNRVGKGGSVAVIRRDSRNLTQKEKLIGFSDEESDPKGDVMIFAGCRALLGASTLFGHSRSGA